MAPLQVLTMVELSKYLTLDEVSFRRLFAGTPVRRLGRDRFIRNVLIAAGNSRNRSLSEFVEPLLRDPSPLVRAMAIWALGELRGTQAMTAIAPDLLNQETDADVRAEWALVIAA